MCVTDLHRKHSSTGYTTGAGLVVIVQGVTKGEVSFPEPEWNLLARGMRVLNCHREEKEMLWWG
jgi:hypothetical protein